MSISLVYTYEFQHYSLLGTTNQGAASTSSTKPSRTYTGLYLEIYNIRSSSLSETSIFVCTEGVLFYNSCRSRTPLPVGAECENDRIDLLLSEICVPSGDGGALAIAASASAGGAPAAPAAESKKEEKVEEKEESDDVSFADTSVFRLIIFIATCV
ncbi:hypothetical protein ACOSQ3_020921 [Xanthoceras sorbifolium]